jgi:hypothetical protein
MIDVLLRILQLSYWYLVLSVYGSVLLIVIVMISINSLWKMLREKS